MRRILCLCLFVTLTATATQVRLKTIFLEGRPTYFIQISDFKSAKEADTQKIILSQQYTSLPIQLDTIPSPTVKIGPIKQYDEAKSIQAQLLSPSRIPPVAAVTSLPHLQQPSSSQKLWNLNNADIRAVIAEVSRLRGKNFIIDPRVQGKISIVSGTPLNNQALYQVFLSMLHITGYTAIPSKEVIYIVPNMEARSLSTNLSITGGLPTGGETMVSVIPVHDGPAEQLVPVLRPLMPPWSYVSAYSPSNMLILSGKADNIQQLTKIIQQVDNSSHHDIDVIPLRHALAMDVARTLKELTKTNSTDTHRALSAIAVDDRNNALLISGSRTERLRLRVIIAKLDQQTVSSTSNHTQVIYLSYLRAEDVVPILASVAQANFSGTVGTTIGTITRPTLDSTNPNANIVGETASVSGSSSSPSTFTNPTATPHTTSTNTQNEGNIKPNIQIIAEPNTNSVIINGPASIIRIIKNVVRQLDIKPAQLLIEALVAEIDAADVSSLGIEWGSLGQQKNVNQFRPGFAVLNSKTSIADFQAQLYALQQKRKANVLSTPSVLVLDNRQAKILVGKQVSVASTSYPNNGNGTTLGSPFTTFNRVNVALHLYVRPQITQGGGIQLQIDQGHDTLDPATTNKTDNTVPVFKISSIVTSVHVQSGDIIILGGLAQDSLGNDSSSIPILGDLPGIGRLFQHRTHNREKRVLMVFIRPIILKTRTDSMMLTHKKYDYARKEQLDFLRTQEAYMASDRETVLPSYHQKKIPIPFSQLQHDEK